MPDVIDPVFRTATVMAALLLAVTLLTAGRRRPAALPGAMLCLAAAAFFVTSASGAGAALGSIGYVLTAVCVTKAVWFWLLARTLFVDGARLRARHIALAVAVSIVGTWQQKVFLPHFRAGSASVLENVAAFGFESLLLILVSLGLYEAWRGMTGDLVERRRHLRLGFIVATGGYLAATLAVQSHNLLLSTTTPAFAVLANMTVVAAGCLIATWQMLQPRRETWIDQTRRTDIHALTPAESVVRINLENAIERERVFVQEGLTIGALAAHLSVAEPVLRRVINQGLGYRNFNDFLHAVRIREACAQLTRPELARQPVLSIAMNVGYGSIGAFNRAFKSRVGVTPTDYRRSATKPASERLESSV